VTWVYFDASALVKRYTAETGTALINELFQRLPADRLTCATIGLLEIVSVLVRKRNDGRLSADLFAQAMLEINHEIIENPAFLVTAIADSLLISALPLIAQHNLNATDAIILQSSLDFQSNLDSEKLILWTSDKRLVRAANQEGLTTFDPEVDTLMTLESFLP